MLALSTFFAEKPRAVGMRRLGRIAGNSFAPIRLCKSMLYALQYESHDQTGGYLPPVFFGRMLLELEAVGGGSPGVIGFFVLDLRKQGCAQGASMGQAIGLFLIA